MRFVTPTPLQTIERVYFNHVGSWLAASSRNELIRTVLQCSPGILIQTKFLEAQKSKKRSCTFLKLIVILSFRNAQIDSELSFGRLQFGFELELEQTIQALSHKGLLVSGLSLP